MNIYLYSSSDIINTYLTKIIEGNLKKNKKDKNNLQSLFKLSYFLLKYS